MKIKFNLLLFVAICCFASCKKTTPTNNRTTLTTTETTPNEDALKIACIGNSITEGSGLDDKKNDSYPAQLQSILGMEYNVQNFGVSGRTLLRKGDFPYWNENKFQQAKDFQPNVVIIKLGTNDTKPQNWKYHEEFVKDYQVFIDEFQALDSKPTIYLCYPVPAFETKYDISNDVIVDEMMPKIKKIADSKELEIIDLYKALEGKAALFPDAIHPNEAGAKIIAETIGQQILANKE